MAPPPTISDNSAGDTAAWMQNRLDGSHHPALNTDDENIVYSREEELFVLLKDEVKPDLSAIYKEAEGRKQAFIATVDCYNANAGRHGGMQMDLHAEHTWDEVLSIQQRFSQQRESQVTKGFKGFLRTPLRRFCDNSDSFKAWLQLLPTQSNYLSVLCGGLTLVLGAAHRVAEIRESIQAIVDDIPSVLADGKQYLQIFADSSELHMRSADLYVAILDILDAIVQEYQKHVMRRLSSALFKQTMSGRDLQEKIRHVKVCGNRVAVQANIDFMQRQKDMYEGEKDVTKMMISTAKHQDRGFNNIARSYQEVSETLERQDGRLAATAEALNQILALLRANPLWLMPPLTGTKHSEPGDSENDFGDPQSRSSSKTGLHRGQFLQELEMLLSKLNIAQDLEVATKDASTQLRLIHTMSVPSQDRAVALIMSPQLQAWITNTSSTALLVNGQMVSSEHEARQSPLSFFCAKLIDSVLPSTLSFRAQSGSPVIVLRWFCGKHTNMQTDFNAHPLGMLNNMLSQLIHQLLESLPAMTPIDIAVPSGDLQLPDLNRLFVQVTEALPTGMIIFCVIDGISCYEDIHRRAECSEVLSMLTTLTRRNQEAVNGPLIKVLVTAPLRSHLAQQFFDVEDVLNMKVQYPSQGGFSALRWDTGIGKVFSS